jgi:thiaminase/transcriptional activator TenA
MTPCVRLYGYLGRSLAGQPFSDTYADWITTYAAPEFDGLAVTLERLLDAYSIDVERERALYRRAMRLELDFFEAAWNPGSHRTA